MNKLLVLLLITSIYSFAKEITFDEALHLLLKNNKQLKSKKLDIKQSHAILDEISANNYGALNFKETYTTTNHAGYAFNSKLSSRKATFGDFGLGSYTGPGSIGEAPDDLNYPKSTENYETKITYDIPLFTGFKISNAKDVAQLQVQAKNKKYQYDEKLLTLELLRAYNACVAAKEYLKSTQKAKEVTKSFVNFSNEMFKEGLVTKIDLNEAQVRDLNTNVKLKEAQNKVSLALSYLSFLVGDEITDVKNFEEVKLSNLVLKNIQEEAINKREDYKYIDLNVKSSKKNIKVEQADYYPKINAHVEYGYSDDKLKNFDDTQDFYLAKVQLNMKIFDMTREAKVEQSRINYNKLMLEKEQFKDSIKLEVKQNYLNYLSNEEILVEKIKAQNLAEEVLIKAEDMYKNKLLKMTDLLAQQASLQKAEAEVIMSKFDLTFMKAKLKLSIGKSLKE
ncbi:outer membrane efflux protein [Arcobacter nitrofigilis DSM 7299]|uniref:Outer membrane efflux protein n=1 Tax=Arcobacter nitrofigilis (strain ATCC 33309 / DSM 7299 / CCUG 15893 / LMG 7604 / NCTC 12251 / CI) TaxID=572480 RepID=D5V217_ARCNC|nr:TolC family protein [Arcobacter nitrofigilis]ADG93601.1 outer membrane efflux protein [Arcobacter nitrofigilis DSM 7299]